MGISTAEAASSADEMLLAQTQVFHHVMAHVGSMSLKCVVELDIPDIIHAHGRPMTVSGLLSKLPVSYNKAPFLPRFMRILTQMGYFKAQKARDEEDAYSLTPLSTILLKNSPISLRAWVLGTLSSHMTVTWQFLSAWLQSEMPGCTHEFEHGKSLWDLASENHEFNSMLNEFMASDTRFLMKYVVEKCGEAFEGLRTLVDVGGGTGTAARAIAEAFPRLKCTVYDLPHVVACLPESPLVDAIGGSMFESVPEADAVFLKVNLSICFFLMLFLNTYIVGNNQGCKCIGYGSDMAFAIYN